MYSCPSGARARRDGILRINFPSWSADGIHKPLSNMRESHVPEVNARIAMEINSDIRRWMGTRFEPWYEEERKPLLFKIVNRMAKENPSLRTEIYMQIMKQLHKNPHRGSELNGWILLSQMCKFVDPHPLLLPYLVAFITYHASIERQDFQAEARFHEEILNVISECCYQLNESQQIIQKLLPAAQDDDSESQQLEKEEQKRIDQQKRKELIHRKYHQCATEQTPVAKQQAAAVAAEPAESACESDDDFGLKVLFQTTDEGPLPDETDRLEATSVVRASFIDDDGNTYEGEAKHVRGRGLYDVKHGFGKTTYTEDWALGRESNPLNLISHEGRYENGKMEGACIILFRLMPGSTSNRRPVKFIGEMRDDVPHNGKVFLVDKDGDDAGFYEEQDVEQIEAKYFILRVFWKQFIL